MENPTNDFPPQASEINFGSDANTASADATPKTFTDAELRQLVDNARKEGYLKGRNEKIEEWLQSTAPDTDDMPYSDLDDDFTCPEFLNRLRPGFWDE